MFWGKFQQNRNAIEEQYRNVQWIESSGLAPEKLKELANTSVSAWTEEKLDRSLIKARLFALVLDKAQLAVTPQELFQDHIRHEFIVQKQRIVWIREFESTEIPSESAAVKHAHALGVGTASHDFGHTVPDWYEIMELGYPGLLLRVREAKAKHLADGTLTEERAVFYEACEIVYEAVLRYLHRLADECRMAAVAADKVNAARLHFCADDLDALCQSAPVSLHQALQLAYTFHILQEEIEGERLRSLGGLDRIYTRFMQADLTAERADRAQFTEMWKDFFQKFHALTGDTFFGEPMYLAGILPDGTCAVNEFSHLILDAYDALNVANPKFHIRVSVKTPEDFLKKVLDYVRKGNSSFVFVSDECTVPMMMKYVGATLEEAREWVPVGCYEPGVLGREIACTGNGGISLPKALELTLNRGVDPLSGEKIGLDLGELSSFDTFDKLVAAYKKQLEHFCAELLEHIRRYERRYMRMNPSPLFSATMHECVEAGKDAYAGGAKYNSSSLYGYGLATVTDSLTILRKFVYESGEWTLEDFNRVLLSNWKGQELLRMRIRKDPDKFGNNRELPDQLACELCQHLADFINAASNARGGHFKAAMFSIDHNYYYGERLGASADGRMKGEIISRNTGASSTMDRSGVTAHIRSVAKLPLGDLPTGSVLDIMLHPSAVSGEEGLEVFYQLLRTYFSLGGYGIHGNVMDAAILRDAQAHPEKYPNLQVRVCGWNVYFVNLSREEQNEFIARAEAC